MLKKSVEAVAKARAYLAEAGHDTILNLHPRLQLDGYSCGLQSLASVLDYFDFDVDLAELADDIGLTKDGCDENQIRRAIRAYGLHHRTMSKMGLGRLQACIDADHPLMVPINNDGHWAVVYGYGDDVIYVMDPVPTRALLRGGKRSIEDFRASWDGWGIEVFAAARRSRSHAGTGKAVSKRARAKTKK